MSYDIAYMWKLKKKKDKNELILKIETDPQIYKRNINIIQLQGYQRGKQEEE